jgi:hypothetical protein
MMRPGRAHAADFAARGVADFRAAGRYLQHLPYGRTADRADFVAVLREGRGTCSTKHALLAALARAGRGHRPHARGTRIDITPAGADSAEPITRLLHEESIIPERIGDYKTALHKGFMRHGSRVRRTSSPVLGATTSGTSGRSAFAPSTNDRPGHGGRGSLDSPHPRPRPFVAQPACDAARPVRAARRDYRFPAGRSSPLFV